MVIGLGISPFFINTVTSSPGDSNWILFGGEWGDGRIWIDTEQWID